MRIKLGKDTNEFKMFMDFWNIMQEVWGIEDSLDYINSTVKLMDGFLKKYNTPFAEGLIGVLQSELQRRKDNGTSD